MKKILLILLVCIYSCKKEYSCEDCKPVCTFKIISKVDSRPNVVPVRAAFIGFMKNDGKMGYCYSTTGEFDNLVVGGTVTFGSCAYKVTYVEFQSYDIGQIDIVHVLLQNGNTTIMYYPGDFTEFTSFTVNQYIKL